MRITIENNKVIIGELRDHVQNVSYTYPETKDSVTFYLNGRITKTVLVKETKVNGEQMTSENIDDLLDNLFFLAEGTDLDTLIDQIQENTELITALNNKIDNIQIGGVNLLNGTDFLSTQDTKLFNIPDLEWWNAHRGKEITISCSVDIDKAILSNRNRVGTELVIVYEDNTYHYIGCWSYPSPTDTYYKRISELYTIQDKEIIKVGQGGCYIQNKDSGIVKIGYPQLELGNKPTAWNLNPKDIDKKQKAIEDKIDNIQIGGVNLLFNSDFRNGTMYYVPYNNKTAIAIDSRNRLNVTGTAWRIHYGIGKLEAGEYIFQAEIWHQIQQIAFRGKTGTYRPFQVFKTELLNDDEQGYRVYARLIMPETEEGYIQLENTDQFKLKKLQLERGNKPTAWSLSPEDIEKEQRSIDYRLNNLKIGGVNLLPDSAKSTYNFFSNNPAVVPITFTDEGDCYSVRSTNNTRISLYSTYPLSNLTIPLDNTVEDIICSIAVMAKVEAEVWISYGTPVTIPANKWTRIFALIPRNVRKYILGVETKNNFGGQKLYFKEYQVERGNMATDWSPAPEDIKIGGVNLLPNSKQTIRLDAESSLWSYHRCYVPLEMNKTYTVSSKVKIIKGSIDSISIYPYPGGAIVNVPIKDGEATYTFTKNTNTINSILLYAGVGGATAGNIVELSEIKIERGNKPTAWSAAPEDIDNKLRDIENKIDTGLNLINNSNFINSFYWREWNKISWSIKNNIASVDFKETAILYSQDIQLKKDVEYTLSADIRSDNRSTLDYNYIISSQNGNQVIPSITGITSDWKRFSITFRPTLDRLGGVGFGAFGSSATSVQFRNIKLEEGNKATIWSAAPQDIIAPKKFDSISVIITDTPCTYDGNILIFGVKPRIFLKDGSSITLYPLTTVNVPSGYSDFYIDTSIPKVIVVNESSKKPGYVDTSRYLWIGWTHTGLNKFDFPLLLM